MMMAVMRDLSFALGILIVPGISIPRILLLVLYGVGLFLFYCGLNEITRSETMSKMVRPGGRRVLAGACCCALVPLVFTVKLLRDSSTLPPILYGLLGLVLCALFLLAALWVYQVSRTGSSPARIRMAVQVSFRAAMMAQAAVAASCGLIVLPLVLLAGLVCSALSEKYAVS